MTTLQIAAILFAVAAGGGLFLLTVRLKGANPPIAFALVHGTIAAAALVTLAVGVIGGAGGAAVVSLVLFVVAAIGGFTLLTMHLRGKLLPIGGILAHGGLAAAGLVTLLVHLFA